VHRRRPARRTRKAGANHGKLPSRCASRALEHTGIFGASTPEVFSSAVTPDALLAAANLNPSLPAAQAGTVAPTGIPGGGSLVLGGIGAGGGAKIIQDIARTAKRCRSLTKGCEGNCHPAILGRTEKRYLWVIMANKNP
jgi:hypothetical protein